eukprot:g816.t1
MESVFKLLVHEPSFSEDELLVDRRWVPMLRKVLGRGGDLLELIHPADPSRRLVLKVRAGLLGEDEGAGGEGGEGDGAGGGGGAVEVAEDAGAGAGDEDEAEQIVSARPAISVLKAIASLLTLSNEALVGSGGHGGAAAGLATPRQMQAQAQASLSVLPPDVHVRAADAPACALDFVELCFEHASVSQAEVWRMKSALVGRPLHLGLQLTGAGAEGAGAGAGAGAGSLLSAQANVNELRGRRHGELLRSGVVTAVTKWAMRSCSARCFCLIPITRELWEFAGAGGDGGGGGGGGGGGADGHLQGNTRGRGLGRGLGLEAAAEDDDEQDDGGWAALASASASASAPGGAGGAGGVGGVDASSMLVHERIEAFLLELMQRWNSWSGVVWRGWWTTQMKQTTRKQQFHPIPSARTQKSHYLA